MGTIAIVDYQSGNLRSCAKAFERMAGSGGVTVTSDPDAVRRADRIVLPGQGAFADCRAGLLAADGLFDAISEAVLKDAKPFFGICVGMQLLADKGLEFGTHPGFGWVGGKVVPMLPSADAPKIPHMGWNDLQLTSAGAAHPVLQNLGDTPHAYFVHSYRFDVNDPANVLATADYGSAVTAVVGRDNLFGTQFHPEKSQSAGLKMIENFLSWAP